MLNVEPRLLRAHREDPVAARMVGRLRGIDRVADLAERDRIQVPVLPGVGGGSAGVRVVGAVQKIKSGQVDKAAETDRGVGARDQERSGEAAAGDRLTRYRLGAQR